MDNFYHLEAPDYQERIDTSSNGGGGGAIKTFCPKFPVVHKFQENLIKKDFNEKHKIVNIIYFISINRYSNNMIIYI